MPLLNQSRKNLGLFTHFSNLCQKCPYLGAQKFGAQHTPKIMNLPLVWSICHFWIGFKLLLNFGTFLAVSPPTKMACNLSLIGLFIYLIMVFGSVSVFVKAQFKVCSFLGQVPGCPWWSKGSWVLCNNLLLHKLFFKGLWDMCKKSTSCSWGQQSNHKKYWKSVYNWCASLIYTIWL